MHAYTYTHTHTHTHTHMAKGSLWGWEGHSSGRTPHAEAKHTHIFEGHADVVCLTFADLHIVGDPDLVLTADQLLPWFDVCTHQGCQDHKNNVNLLPFWTHFSLSKWGENLGKSSASYPVLPVNVTFKEFTWVRLPVTRTPLPFPTSACGICVHPFKSIVWTYVIKSKWSSTTEG